jgi:hypothetical protein
MVRERGGAQLPATQFFHDHTLHVFTMPGLCLDPGAEPWSVQLALHKRPFHGCSVWWDISAMYKPLGATSCKGQAWKWVLKAWAAWGAALQRMGAPAAHLRKQQPYGGCVDGERPHDFPSVSTFALVLILARFASGGACSGGLREEHAAAAARKMFSNFVTLALDGQGHTMVLYFDKAATTSPPSFPEGDNPCKFKLDGAKLHKLPLESGAGCHADGLKEWRGLVESLPSDVGTVGICSLISAVVGMGAKLAHIARQLIWFLAICLDSVVKLQLTVEQVLKDNAKSVGKQGFSKNNFFFWREWRKREKLIWKYWLASREVFSMPQFLSVSLDASRVAKKGMVYGVIVLPDGRAMWACPQVKRGPDTNA